MRIDLDRGQDIQINLNGNHTVKFRMNDGKLCTLYFIEKTASIQIYDGKLRNINIEEDCDNDNLNAKISSRGETNELSNEIKIISDGKLLYDEEGNVFANEPAKISLIGDEFLTSPECDKKCKENKSKQPYKIRIKKCSTFDDWYRTYTGQSFVVESYIENEGFWVRRKNYKTTYFVNINDAEILEYK